MKCNALAVHIACCLLFTFYSSSAHDIYFCGEKIPLDDRLVSGKLMNVIRKQINYVKVPSLQKRINQYFSTVERYLRATGLPEDLKYLAIVESGFENRVSRVGAAGFWQFMDKTAREWGLLVNGSVDERNDFYKSTYAACKLLASYYLSIRKQFGISSWVLTAAAYNNGIGNIRNAITKQGNNYFQMNLNAETALYVYKIIAVKELLEYPELYMKDFGYNVFNAALSSKDKGSDESGDADLSAFDTMTVKVNEADGSHPAILTEGVSPVAPVSGNREEQSEKIKFASAQITGKYKNFKDGDIISLTLADDLQVANRFTRRGTTIQGRGWLIEDRVFIDLGYEHNVILYDLNVKRGVALADLKNKEQIILKISEPASL